MKIPSMFLLLGILLIYSGNLFADINTMIEVDNLIKDGTDKNKKEIYEKAINLSDNEKYYLQDKYLLLKEVPAVLNLFVPFAIGSIIQGDLLWIIFGNVFDITAIALMVKYPYGAWFIAAGLLPFRIIGLIRAITFPDIKNTQLHYLLFGGSKLTMSVIPFQNRQNLFYNKEESGVLGFISYQF